MKIITKFELFESINIKKLILLVGPPGSGKSYYINKINNNKEYVVINRDDIVIEVAEEVGLTYKEMFNRPNLILGEDRIFYEQEPEYYQKQGKTYVKGMEKFGEVLELPEDHYSRRWTDKQFKLLLILNDEIDKRFNDIFKKALDNKMSIIIDMTNVYKEARKKIIEKLGNKRKEYIVKAVIFNDGGLGMDDLIIKINRKRDIELRKIKREKDIPDSVLKSFITRYEEPSTIEEDIDEVEFIKNKENLEKYVREEVLEKNLKRFYF